MRWFSGGDERWRPEGRRVVGHRVKVPIGRWCKKCGQQIKLTDKGFLVPNPWEKVADVFHTGCMPQTPHVKQRKESAVDKEIAAIEAMVAARHATAAPTTTATTNGAHAPEPAEPAPPEQHEPALPKKAVPPKKGELSAFLRTIDVDALKKMTPAEIALAVRKGGIFITELQAYQARYHVLLRDYGKARPAPRAPQETPPPPTRRTEPPMAEEAEEQFTGNGTTARVWTFLKAYLSTHDHGPTTRDLMKATGKNPGQISSSLRTLQRNALISFQSGDYSSIRLVERPKRGSKAKSPKRARTANGASPIRTQIEAMIEQIKEQAEDQINAIKEKTEARVAALETALQALE